MVVNIADFYVVVLFIDSNNCRAAHRYPIKSTKLYCTSRHSTHVFSGAFRPLLRHSLRVGEMGRIKAFIRTSTFSTEILEKRR